jgi:hypothetical protein
MLNGEAVVVQARRGAVFAGGQVWHAQERYFLVQTAIAGVFVLLMIFGFFYLLSNSNQAFTIGGYGSAGGPLDSTALAGWRTFDFVAGGLFAAAMLVLLVRSAAASANAGDQVLVLLPDGLVLGTGKTPKTYPFAAFRAVSLSSTRGTVSLSLTPAAGGRAVRVPLDGRFGKAKPIAQAILVAHRQFVSGYQPSQPIR